MQASSPLGNRSLLLISALSFSLSGCGGSSSSSTVTTTPPPQVSETLYAQGELDINAFTIDASSGKLAALQTLATPSSTFSSDLGFGGIVATSPARFLYASNSDNNGINAFSIATDGSLSLVGGSPFMLKQVFGAPQILGLVVNPNGSALYAVDDGLDIQGLQIDSATGALTLMANIVIPGSDDSPESLIIDPSGQFMYVSSSSTELPGYQSSVLAFSIASTSGNLTALATPEFGLDQVQEGDDWPTDIAINPTGSFLYGGLLSGTNEQNAVGGFVRNSTTGELTAMAGSPSISGPYSAHGSMTIHPSGKFLYSYNWGETASIGAFSIDSTSGALTPVAGSPFAFPSGVGSPGGAPIPLVIDPSGMYLYTVCECYSTGCSSSGEEMLIYNVDQSTGALTEASGSPMPLSENLFSLASFSNP